MRRIMTRTVTMTVAAAAVSAFTLAACGGGGGGGSSIVYSGLTTPAAITSDNALALAGTAYDSGNSGGSLAFVGTAADRTTGSEIGAARAVNVAHVLVAAVRSARFGPSSETTVAAGATTSGSLPAGTCGGSATYSGTADESTGEFHATFRFTAWCNEGVTVSGTLNADGLVDVSTQDLASLEFSFSVLTIDDGTNTFQGRGTISVTFGASDVLTIDMDFGSGDGTIYRASNLIIESSLNGSDETVTVTGRVFHPLHGYVDVTTPQALVVVSGDDYPSSGELVVTGAGGSRARITAVSATTFRLDVDEDGNGSYETMVGTFEWGTRDPVVG
ncbi:MAG: hypothetical protein ACOYXU_08145 [Nitrospirota bacterium]